MTAMESCSRERRSRRVTRAQAGLVVVDVQERLLPAIHEQERVVENTRRLIKGAEILGVPVFVTEQYRKGLGPTAPVVAEVLSDFAPMEKVAFSACGAEGFLPALQAKGVTDVIVCGIEAHVCVSQTCLDLVVNDLMPFLVDDAVSSRTRENWRLGVERMRDAGALVVSTEMIRFELLEQAGTDEFRRILELVK